MRAVPPPTQRDGPVPGALEVRHRHQLLQVADVQAVAVGSKPM